MTASASGWSSRRWISVSALLALLHAGGFWAVTRFPQGPRLGKPDTFELVWSSTSTDVLEGSILSPTRFALPESGGFSGDAAQALPPVTYGWGRSDPRPSFLPADPSGSNLGPAPGTPAPPTRAASPRAVTPISDSTVRMTADQARSEIRGNLAARQLARPLSIPPWTEGDSPQPTRIELAVNPWGEVLTARVIVGSGSKPADLAALEAVRSARFKPLPEARSSDALQADRLTWGVMSIHPVPGDAIQKPGNPL